MEEYLAKRWATYLHKREHSSRYEQACVYFEDQKKSLQLFYLLFCGTQAKELKVADKRFIKKSRTFFEKLSGSGDSATLCWQDDSALYLPPQLGYFPTKEQNELHYIWLIGMFCHIAPVIDDDSFDEDALENAEDLDAVTLGNKKADLLARVKMDLHLLASDEEVYPQIQEHCLDEWDYRRNGYLVGYAHICPLYQDEVEPIALPKRLLTIVKKIQNELDRMHLDRIKITNLLYGDRINLYRWIAYESSEHKRDNTQRFYESFEKKSRDVATLILADTSLSTESGITQETSIIDVIKDALMVFSEALKRLEDRFAIYTFSSVKNKNIYFQTIIDRYDGKYGVEDTKKAILEAKKQQVVPFCITIDTEAKSYLPYIFGQNNYAVVYESEKLPQILSEIYIHLTK